MKKVMKKVMIGVVLNFFLTIIALVMLCSCEDNNYNTVQPECSINYPIICD